MYNYIRRSIYKRGPGSGGVDVWGKGGQVRGGLRGRLKGEGGGGHCYFYFLRNLFVLVI